MSWDLVDLGSISQFINGDRGKNYPSKKDFVSSGVAFINAGHMFEGKIDFSEMNYISQEKYNNLGSGKVQKHDILFCLRGSLGKNAIIDFEDNGAIASSLLILRNDEKKSYYKYLFWFLNSPLVARQITKNDNGSSQPNLSATNVKTFKIPLPPLPEQKRIASILDATDALRSKRRQAIAMLDELLQATFLDMFGEHFSAKNYRTTEKYKISELVSYIDYRGKTPKKTDSGIPLITAKNVKTGYISEEPREYISAELYEEWMTRGLPKTKDVLFTTEAPLGNVALLGEYEKVVVGQRLVSLRCKEKLVPEYLMFALLQPYIKMLINQRSSGSTVRGIRTKEFYQIEIPTPPLTLQTQFAKIVEKVEAQKAVQQAHLAELDTLFASLQQRAFAGDL